MFENRDRSSRWATRLGVGLALGLALGACDHANVFSCADDEDCHNAGERGVCEASGWCSFFDPDCDSDKRYGEYATEDLAETCVPLITPYVDVINELEPRDVEDDGATVDEDASTDGGATEDPEYDTSDGSSESETCPDDPDLVLCLDFETVEGSTVFDDADPTITGELQGDAEIVEGLTGDALTLRGDGYLNLGYQLGPVESFSVEATFWFEAPAVEWAALIEQWSDDRGFWLGGSSPPGGLEFWVDGTIAEVPEVQTDQWVHVLATFDAESGELLLYVDGQEVASATHQGPMTPTAANMLLGGGDHDDTPARGQTDGVRLWDRVVRPEEL